ncbi:helix-turn-helix domain-containing protein [uncultured Microbacterium sp.]|uniref:helix-turn-helix domain-containing protein n=1 Tax=uncultured Microbacterium sp. TaxID=191216 RepID=UPI003436DE72
MSSAVEHPSPEAPAHLAPRELALRMKGDGMTNTAIARATGVHPSTVGRWLATPALAAASEGGAL